MDYKEQLVRMKRKLRRQKEKMEAARLARIRRDMSTWKKLGKVIKCDITGGLGK